MNLTVQEVAQMLHQARKNAQPVEQLSQTTTVFSEKQVARKKAYDIQNLQLQHRLLDGEELIGWKMGLTSEAKRKQMNLDSPLYGHLTNRMEVQKGQDFALAGSIHPKVEPEVAFRLKKKLSGEITREQAYDAIDEVFAALEILDSRYKQFKYFSMEDVISDNSSSSHFVLGPATRDFQKLKLDQLAMKMIVRDGVILEGNSRDISGDPVQSLVELSRLLAVTGREILPGEIVLAGAATQAVELTSGMEVILEVQGLMPVTFNVGSEKLKVTGAHV